MSTPLVWVVYHNEWYAPGIHSVLGAIVHHNIWPESDYLMNEISILFAKNWSIVVGLVVLENPLDEGKSFTHHITA